MALYVPEEADLVMDRIEPYFMEARANVRNLDGVDTKSWTSCAAQLVHYFLILSTAQSSHTIFCAVSSISLSRRPAMPTVVMEAQPPLLDPCTFRLDPGGEKSQIRA
eukprot:9761275-Karenia_brevis.AAC.1